MIDQESRDKISQLYITMYGVEGQGGLLREVEGMDGRIEAVEKRLNAISGKWLFLMLLAGLLGNALSTSAMKFLTSTLHLIP